MADAGPQNKDRIWAFKREVHNLEQAIMALQKDIQHYEFEASLSKDKIIDMEKDMEDRKKQLQLYLNGG